MTAHVMSDVEYVASRAKEPLNSPYKAACCCGWVTWRADMESCRLAHARHVARQVTAGPPDDENPWRLNDRGPT